MSYTVVGFYTPDYKHLADRFSENLRAFDIPHILYSVSAAEWIDATLMKPSILWRAGNEFPEHTLVFMDVDCIIRGDISPIVDCAGDVALYMSTRRKGKRSIRVNASSRIIVAKPTAKSRELIAQWERRCRERTGLNDEQSLMMAISDCKGLTVSQLPRAYAAREVDEADMLAVIVHKSQHATITRPLWAIQRWLKAKRRAIVSRALGRPYAAWKYGQRS